MAVKQSNAEGFPPIARPDAPVLVLGTMPGAESLRTGQYYANPQNQFWWIMGELVGAVPELPYEKRCGVLMDNGVAVWDVLAACVREGSLDSNIDDSTAEPNDFSGFFERHSQIRAVFFNGKKAEKAFMRQVYPKLDNSVERRSFAALPSTSPAYAAMSKDKKLEAWRSVVLINK